MWSWLSCFLSGRHEYVVSCQPGTVFLRCVHCGRRGSEGWSLHDERRRDPRSQGAGERGVPPLHKFDSARTGRGQ